MRKSCGLISTLVITLLSLSPAVKANDDDEPGFRFQYAAKFSCGSVAAGVLAPVMPGQYTTAVAIHNPQAKDVTLRKKVALVFPPGGQKPGQISAFVTEKLTPDQALEVSCHEIPSTFAFPAAVTGSFVQGFLVIETTRSVDVVATYSAGQGLPGSAPTPAATTTSTVATVEVERIKERKISREDDDKDRDKDKDREGDKEGDKDKR
jgi:hypothetical protein